MWSASEFVAAGASGMDGIAVFSLAAAFALAIHWGVIRWARRHRAMLRSSRSWWLDTVCMVAGPSLVASYLAMHALMGIDELALGHLREGASVLILVGVFVTFPVSAAVGVLAHSLWRKRLSPGRCSRCGYDLTGNVTGVCPECGERVVE
ncbi:MAG: hypothetical protein H6817_09655 [Phycisphaerales bacterium]|nr:hypothetical protein [Phycisphaerales bacterium]